MRELIAATFATVTTKGRRRARTSAVARANAFARALAFGGLVFGIAGCIPMTPHRSEPSYEPAYPLLPPPEPPTSGGLYQTGFGIDLYDDHRAMRAGDIVTIVLQEV